jgi:hypothetical protein
MQTPNVSELFLVLTLWMLKALSILRSIKVTRY